MAVVRVDALRKVAAGAITNSYLPLGAVISRNWRMFRITNSTDGDLLVSFDGTTDNLFVPRGSFVLYDCASNAVALREIDNFFIGINTQLYVKYYVAPTTGDIWAEGVYSRTSP